MLIVLFTLHASVGRWSVSALFLPESGAPDPVSEKSAWKALTSAHTDKMNHIFESSVPPVLAAVNTQIASKIMKMPGKKSWK